MSNQEGYSRTLEELFKQYRISELNEKIRAANLIYDKKKNFNVITPSEFEEFVDSKDDGPDEKDSPDDFEGTYGEVIETLKKAVNRANFDKFDKWAALTEVKKIDPNVKDGSVFAALKRWAKDKNDLTGIEIFKKGKGPNPTIFRTKKF